MHAIYLGRGRGSGGTKEACTKSGSSGKLMSSHGSSHHGMAVVLVTAIIVVILSVESRAEKVRHIRGLLAGGFLGFGRQFTVPRLNTIFFQCDWTSYLKV